MIISLGKALVVACWLPSTSFNRREPKISQGSFQKKKQPKTEKYGRELLVWKSGSMVSLLCWMGYYTTFASTLNRPIPST
jgi:hypothetical protein